MWYPESLAENLSNVTATLRSSSVIPRVGSFQGGLGSLIFTIFIRSLQGSIITMVVKVEYSIRVLKSQIYGKIGNPAAFHLLLYKGKLLDNNSILSNFSILRDAVIFLNACLHGGVSSNENSSPSKPSFKDVLHKKTWTPFLVSLATAQAYIVERVYKATQLELLDLIIVIIHDAYASRGIIYRFNELWKGTVDLYKWIHST